MPPFAPTTSHPSSSPIDHVVERGADDAPALVLRSRTLSYRDLRSRIGRLAGAIAAMRLPAGARVASWCAKGEATCLLPLAAPRAGLVHVPINPQLKRAQVAHILKDSGANLLVATPSRLSTLEAGDVPTGCALMGEEEFTEQAAAAEPLPPLDAAPDDLAAILYTSGSTGAPKGVMLSHANFWLGAASVAQYTRLDAADTTLAVLPLAFDYGQNQLFSTWFAGGSVVPLDYLTPRDVIKACARHRATTLAAVPPLWLQLVEAAWLPDAVAPLRRLTNSGGALTPSLVARLRTLFPDADLYAMYGLTEAFRSTYLDPALVDAHPTSIGRAIPFAEVLVTDDEGNMVVDGAEGELVHCGPLVAKGYWRDPERTAQRFRPAPAFANHAGLAVWSGDRVRRDAEGLLHFVGRRDAMIKSAGNRISPQEIEDATTATGLVAEAVALGVPDDRLGEAIHLVVRLTGEQDEAGLLKALRTVLPNFMQPARIHWRDTLPRNPNGKLDRAALLRDIAG